MEDARDLIDQTVMVKLIDTEGLEFTGIEGDNPFFCKVVAVDEIGMWVENSKFVTIELTDCEGRDIPVKNRKKEVNRVNFLLPWRNVMTVVKFPGKEDGDFAPESLVTGEEEQKRIGFIK